MEAERRTRQRRARAARGERPSGTERSLHPPRPGPRSTHAPPPRLQAAIAEAARALDALAQAAEHDRARALLATLRGAPLTLLDAADALETLALVARGLDGTGNAAGALL